MKIVWWWTDGWMGGRPSQTYEIPDERLKGLPKEERDEVIGEIVHELLLDQVKAHWREEK